MKRITIFDRDCCHRVKVFYFLISDVALPVLIKWTNQWDRLPKLTSCFLWNACMHPSSLPNEASLPFWPPLHLPYHLKTSGVKKWKILQYVLTEFNSARYYKSPNSRSKHFKNRMEKLLSCIQLIVPQVVVFFFQPQVHIPSFYIAEPPQNTSEQMLTFGCCTLMIWVKQFLCPQQPHDSCLQSAI